MYQRSADSNKRLREAVTEAKENGHQVLSFLLAKVDTDIFERGLAGFIKFGGNINHLNDEGQTILDVCDFLSSGVRDHVYRRTLIVNAGGKLGRDVSDIARLRAAESIIPGWDNFSIFSGVGTVAVSAYRKFSFEDKELQTLSEFLAAPIVQHSDQAGGVDVCAMLTTIKPAIGKLFDAGSFVSTLFLIKDDWVITARHSVNYSKPENLTVMFGNEDFDENTAIPIAGAIESGKSSALDYVILKLSKPIPEVTPLVLSSNNTSTSLLFVGYNEGAVLQFSANPDFNSGNFDQLKVVGYQGTGACFSGSPYFDLEGHVCGLHSCASTDQKTGIYIKTIIETNSNAPLARFIRGEDVSNAPLLPGTFFPEFKCSTSMFEFDERGPLKMTVASIPPAVFEASGASNNQSNVGAKKKIAKRLERLRTAGKTLTDVQQRFLAVGGSYKIPANENIQIAHNIAISAMTTALISKMNTAILPANEAAEIAAAEEFADAIASSDDEDPAVPRRAKIKEKLPNLVRKIRTEQKKAGGITTLTVANSLIADAKEVLTLLNGRSKNLMPGHAEVNEHLVRSHRDPHLTKTATGYEETVISARLSLAADAFFGVAHTPQPGAHGTFASSSVDSGNVKANAYFKP